jgi:RHS repeat-associated protein
MMSKPLKSLLAMALVASAASQTHAQIQPTTQFEYDALGNLSKVTDPLGRQTNHTIDALSRTTLTVQPAPTLGGATPSIGYQYDLRDALTQVTDPRSLNTTYTVNGLGQVSLQTSPDTGNTTRTFDALGRLLTTKDARNKTSSFTYDAANRVKTITYGDATVSTFTYDGNNKGQGRMIAMSDPGNLNTTWDYDIFGRLAVKYQSVKVGTTTINKPLTTSYGGTTELSQLSVIGYPSQRIQTFHYWGNTKELAFTKFQTLSIATNIEWFPDGTLKSMLLGNGITHTRTQDLNGRITSYTLNGQTETLTWDAASRLTQLTRTGPATPTPITRTYTYDGLDRLTGYTGPLAGEAYSYDATGNRTSATVGAATRTYTTPATSNRLTALTNPAHTQTLDASGNVTADGTGKTYIINARGRLYQAKPTSAQTVTYQINGLGQRIQKSGPTALVPSGQRIFIYDEAGKLLSELDNLGRAQIEHVWIGDMPVAAVTYTYTGTSTTVATTTVSYIEADHLNTPRLITNTAKQAVWSWESNPFGSTLANSNPSSLGVYTYNLRFPGQYFDSETGLHYNYHRDYRPDIGRYVQSDPIGLAGGINTYAYVNGNPVVSVDPFGLAPYQPKNTVEAWCLKYPTACREQERELYNQLKKKKLSGVSGKDGAKDCPSWAKEDSGPLQNENAKDYAKRLLDDKYGQGNWGTGSGTEYSQIQKWATRSFE